MKFNVNKLKGKKVLFKTWNIPDVGKPYFKEYEGQYIQIGSSFEEFQDNTVQISTGIIIDVEGKLHNIPVENIKFI